MASDNGRFLCCPLCHGKGQTHRSELIERLSDPHIREELEALLQELKRQEHEDLAPVTAARDDFEREVHSWPPRRMLWRRSPKE